MNIAIIQIGLDDNFKIAKHNHELLYKVLSEKYNINIYNFYRQRAIPDCPFFSTGLIQVYDFFTSLQKTSEDIVIKMRSDIFLTKSAINVLCEEIDAVIKNEIDISYIGMYFSSEYNKICFKANANLYSKVADKIVIARKSKLNTNWFDVLSKLPDSVSGNLAYLTIKKEDAVARMVSCQIYVVEKDLNIDADNWTIYKEWCQGFARKSAEAVNWVINNKDIINKF